MLKMIRLPADRRYAMAANARKRIEENFDERFAIDRYIQVLEQLPA
jgi:hypothetical protein